MLVQISHEKPYGKRFDVFSGNKKLKGGEEYDLPDDGAELTFVEYNAVVGRFWFLLVFVNFIVGILSASFSDFKDERRARTVIRLRLGKVENDEIFIRFAPFGTQFSVEGAAWQELERYEEPLPQVERRVKAYKITVISVSLAFLCAVLALLVFAIF